jgi:hypothetical protein
MIKEAQGGGLLFGSGSSPVVRIHWRIPVSFMILIYVKIFNPTVQLEKKK